MMYLTIVELLPWYSGFWSFECQKFVEIKKNQQPKEYFVVSLVLVDIKLIVVCSEDTYKGV